MCNISICRGWNGYSCSHSTHPHPRSARHSSNKSTWRQQLEGPCRRHGTLFKPPTLQQCFIVFFFPFHSRRFYQKLAGMTGTARSAAAEFYEIYGLRVVPIPTNKPPRRKDLPLRLYYTEQVGVQGSSLPGRSATHRTQDAQECHCVCGWVCSLVCWFKPWFH